MLLKETHIEELKLKVLAVTYKSKKCKFLDFFMQNIKQTTLNHCQSNCQKKNL